MSERRRLDAVLLDAGGTLVRLDFEWMSEAVRSLGGDVTAESLRRAEIEGRRRYDSSRGRRRAAGALPEPLGATGDTRAYFDGTLEAAGVDAARRAPALERFHARHLELGLWTRPMEGAREALDGLAALGLRLAVVSNSDGRAEMHLRDCGVRDGLEFVVDSHRVGVEKPDAGIFRIALDRLGVAPERALFVGDIRSVDEAGAKSAGLDFVLLDPYHDYGGGALPALASIRELPDWIAGRYATPVPAPGAATTTTNRPPR